MAFGDSVSKGKFGFQQHKLDFARAAQSHLTNSYPSVSVCGLFGRTFGLCILNREGLSQEKKVWNDCCVLLYNLELYNVPFWHVLVGAAIQNPYPILGGWGCWSGGWTWSQNQLHSCGSFIFLTGHTVPPCGHITNYSVQVRLIQFKLWEVSWVQLLLKCDQMSKISVIVDVAGDGLQPEQILCHQNHLKGFSKVSFGHKQDILIMLIHILEFFFPFDKSSRSLL